MVCQRELVEQYMAKKKRLDEAKSAAAETMAREAAAIKAAQQKLDAYYAAFPKLLNGAQRGYGFSMGYSVDVEQAKQLPEGTQVRVMKYEADGRMTDVTDKVNPRDLSSNNITDFGFEGIPVPTMPDGQLNRAAALELLRQVITSGNGLAIPGGRERGGLPLKSPAIQRMEATLEESEKILKHWR